MKKTMVLYQIYASKVDENGLHQSSALKKTDIIFKNEIDAKTFCSTQSNKRDGIIYIYKNISFDYYTNLEKVEEVEFSNL